MFYMMKFLYPSQRGITRELIYERFQQTQQCPCCKTEGEFLVGPTGGCEGNVMCAACGTRLNVVMWNRRVLNITWTHGPQSEIWNGNPPTETPDPAHVERIKNLLC